MRHKLFLPIIAQGGLQLRPIGEEELGNTLNWRNHKESKKYFLNSNTITKTQHFSWFRDYQAKSNDYLFVIFDGNQLVGQISIYNINSKKREGEIGRILIDPNQRGKGYMKHAIHLIHLLAFEYFSLTSLYLTVLGSNPAAMNLYLKLGYQIEAVNDAEVFMRINLD